VHFVRNMHTEWRKLVVQESEGKGDVTLFTDFFVCEWRWTHYLQYTVFSLCVTICMMAGIFLNATPVRRMLSMHWNVLQQITCLIQVKVFWIVTPCNVVVEYQHFRGLLWRWRRPQLQSSPLWKPQNLPLV
jgi:hypothetical protein